MCLPRPGLVFDIKVSLLEVVLVLLDVGQHLAPALGVLVVPMPALEVPVAAGSAVELRVQHDVRV